MHALNVVKFLFIIDDDKDDIDLVCQAINRVNNELYFESAQSVTEAFEKLKQFAILPDLILLDLNMPFADGKQCLTALKKDARLKNIPVIIYSTSDLDKDKEEAISLGASKFITKPATFTGVMKMIMNVITMDFSAPVINQHPEEK